MKHLKSVLGLLAVASIAAATVAQAIVPSWTQSQESKLSLTTAPQVVVDMNMSQPLVAGVHVMDSSSRLAEPQSVKNTLENSVLDKKLTWKNSVSNAGTSGLSESHEAQPPTPEMLRDLYLQVWFLVSQRYHDPAKLTNWADWKAHAQDIQTPEDFDKAMKNMLDSLQDRWTYYVSPTEIANHKKLEDQGITDLGLMLKEATPGKFVVDYLFYGSPAQRSLLKDGDRIFSIGGKKLDGMSLSEAKSMTLGQKGTTIEVVYGSGDEQLGKVELTVVDTLQNNFQYKLLPGNIGYLRIPDFDQDNTAGLMLTTIHQLNEESKNQLSGLVIDLRGNPGGDFTQAVSVASLFIKQGTIVSGVTSSGRIMTVAVRQTIAPPPVWFDGMPTDEKQIIELCQTLPIDVLADGNSASGAELVTGALKDNQRATIIGTNTWGKAVGYSVIELPNGGNLSFTDLDYRTPSGFDVSHIGISPNIVVEQPRYATDDKQLAAAEQDLLRKMSPGKSAAATFFKPVT